MEHRTDCNRCVEAGNVFEMLFRLEDLHLLKLIKKGERERKGRDGAFLFEKH